VRPFDDKVARKSRLAGMLRVQDGQTGRIETGTSLPFLQHVSPYGAQVGYASAASGFEASPQLLGDGRVRVSLQPYEGSVGKGGVIHSSGASTDVTVAPGGTVAIGGLEQSREGRSRSLGGAAEEKSYEDWVLLLRVEVEGRPASAPAN
jgi:hypothetical protein